jgi:hypothetical protein
MVEIPVPLVHGKTGYLKEGVRSLFDHRYFKYRLGQDSGLEAFERYKKSPELVREIMKKQPSFSAPGQYIVFKRWDRLEENDFPEGIIFFCSPDVLSGIFTLANFDEAEPNGVFSPFGAGCASIVLYPYMENSSSRPRAVLGMLDVSARPCVSADVLTLAVPMKKFVRMVAHMEESFLITPSWRKVKRRIGMAKRQD